MIWRGVQNGEWRKNDLKHFKMLAGSKISKDIPPGIGTVNLNSLQKKTSSRYKFSLDSVAGSKKHILDYRK
jgi:hypothetical protein